MDINKRKIIYIGVAVLVALLMLWGIFRESPVVVEAAKSKRGRMTVTVDTEGKTRVHDKFTVTAPVSGMMARIKLTEGDNISRNFPLAEIDPNPPIQRTPTERRDSPNPYAARVFAPVPGRILRVFDKSERYITAGTPILELGDPENLEIVMDVLSTEAVRIRPGAAILIESGTESAPVKARVRLIESQAITKISALGVEEQRVNVIGEFLSKGIGFGDNFRIDVRIVVWESDDVLMVPTSAVFRSGEGWGVFVIESGRAQQRPVEIGHQNNEDTQVLNGLSEGETVILHPPNHLVDGAPVEAR